MRLFALSVLLSLSVSFMGLGGHQAWRPAEAAFPGANGRIAFAGTAANGPIMTVNSEDGSDLQVLGDGVQPTWSADGGRIAFSMNLPGSSGDIWVMDGDGSDRMPLTSSPDTDSFPAWSPDGEQIAFVRVRPGAGSSLWAMNDDGTNQRQLTNMAPALVTGHDISWSPDGSQVLFTGTTPAFPTVGGDLYVVPAGGGGATNITNTAPVIPDEGDVNYNTEAKGDWSPDGGKIAFLGVMDSPEADIWIMNAGGGGRQLLVEDAANYTSGPSWSPDGTKIAYSGGPQGNEIKIVTVSGAGTSGLGLAGRSPDWQPLGDPIIFLHGFLGSSILCDGGATWPALPPDFDSMALGADGVSPAPGACSASVGETIDTFLGSDVYGSTIDYLKGSFGDNASMFAWDWRKSPDQSLALLDDHIDDVLQNRNADKVVLMAHSYGGLLARLYINSPSRVDKVARVVTIGTPAWGAPKALFPLYAGVETPEFSTLDAIVPNDELKEFAKNLTGSYFLYPSASYGPWLTLLPSNTPVDQQGLLGYVGTLGGNPGLLSQALSEHASILDSLPTNGVEFEVIVGAGLPTIGSVQIDPNGHVIIGYDDGDGTVPARSAARGQVGAGNPNAAHTHYTCGIGHVPLPGHQVVTDAIEPFLRTGDAIDGLSQGSCGVSGLQFRLLHATPLPVARVAGRGASAAVTPEEADTSGEVDYLDFPKEKYIVTGEEFPEMVLPAAAFLEITRIGEEGALGEALRYGPFTGEVTVRPDNGWALVLEDGVPVAGEPVALSGDVDCSGAVNSIDALKLSRHVAGLPVSQTEPCPDVGTGDGDAFGDVNCDGNITAVDTLFVLRFVAALPVNVPQGCRPVGTLLSMFVSG